MLAGGPRKMFPHSNGLGGVSMNSVPLYRIPVYSGPIYGGSFGTPLILGFQGFGSAGEI